MLLLLQLLLHLTSALSPGDTLPSCLDAGVTWEQDGIYDLAFHLASPEACQQLCAEDPVCLGFTWLTAEAQLLPLSCSLFEQTNTELACEECVSGPGERCGCSQEGECQIQEGNLIESRDGVSTAEDCEQICVITEGCNFYTYLGEGNHFRHTCFLFSSCEAFIAECDDCTTGLPECNICSFENTLPTGLCKESCKDGWSSFEKACYKIVDDFNYEQDDIVMCRSLCESAGGNLPSIHSKEENTFVHSLLRPDNKSNYGLNPTWLGAELVSDATVMGDYRYVWEDASPWDYTNWWTDEPDMNPSFACVSIGVNPSSPDKWTDGSCHSSYSTFDCLCKISDDSSSATTSTTISITTTNASVPPTTISTTSTTYTTSTTTKTTTTTTTPATCGDGWSQFNSSCYTILNYYGWHYNDIKICRKHCAEDGGTLGSVHSQEENDFIYQLLRPARSGFGEQATWLGGVAGGEWEDGTPWDFTYWFPGQPDDDQSSCVIMGWNNKFPESWDDGACDWPSSIFDCLCKRNI